MTNFCKASLRWVSFNFSSDTIRLISYNVETLPRITPTIRIEAQSALCDYLHLTRSLPFVDAQHISQNSPHFLKNLIENASSERVKRPSVARFLRYHPINEYEPFFESIGLDPCQFLALFPRDCMFLSDDRTGLLDNYCVLCQYGITRGRIGKVYRVAREVFHDCNGCLELMLRDFEEVGISKPVIAKALCYNPSLLIDGMGMEFFKVVAKLQCLGCEYDWVEHNLLENVVYNWRQIFELLNVISELFCNDYELGKLVRQHPDILFDRSGRCTLTLIGFLIKLGSSKREICSLMLHFPQINVGKFVRNLRRSLEMLDYVEMDNASIGSIFRTHCILLGSCSLKKPSTIRYYLNIGKRRLCEVIRENPIVLKNWVWEAKIERLPHYNVISPYKLKMNFLSRIGFSGNSKHTEKVLKLFQGRAEELQERYVCLIEAGLSEEDVVHMIKRAPQILGQSKDVIDAKIRYLVSDLGYPVSGLAQFPRYLSYSIERVKLRCSMYKWLVDRNAIRPSLTLSTIITSKESKFVKKYVEKHPGGPDVWQELKKSFPV